MKILGNEIKPGMIIEHKNDLWSVLKAQHVKPGKGGAFNQVELKSINKGTKLNERFRSSDTVERAVLDDKKFNFISEFTSKEELIEHIENDDAFTLILNPDNVAEDKNRRQGNIMLFDQLMNDCKNINFNLKTYFNASSPTDCALFFYKPIEFEKETNQLSLYKSLIHRFLPMIPYFKKIYLYIFF